ncbi:integrin beta-1-binding protein 2 isoform X4 [Accipiter gentilis]|uniref:integrin beta-1-binding protein 2 isoform X4 n=1 Tax=Astur gentilis TaxID=8957 RepID=UPI00210F5930|nr:integrin beta-1-binding protein 2 isoform X4 [Accipiter gentilis]
MALVMLPHCLVPGNPCRRSPCPAGLRATRAQKLTGLGAAARLGRAKQASGLPLLLRDAQRGFTARRSPLSLSAKRPQTSQRLIQWRSLSSKDQNQLRRCSGKDQGEAAAQVRAGTTCKNAACKAIYQGPESNIEVCTFHPGVPVFHEGMKYWSCCGVKTTDFSAFLEQLGCSSGQHCWTGKGDKKAVSCRQDWHQTSSQVVVTVYAKNPLPALSSVKANHTVLEVHIIFEGNKIFQAELDLWGVIEIEKSFVSMVPTKVEIMLCKASPGSWARLELPQSRSYSHGEQKEAANAEEPRAVQGEDSDDSLSWSEEEDEELEMGTPSN